jgi:hypothetical protein
MFTRQLHLVLQLLAAQYLGQLAQFWRFQPQQWLKRSLAVGAHDTM